MVACSFSFYLNINSFHPDILHTQLCGILFIARSVGLASGFLLGSLIRLFYINRKLGLEEWGSRGSAGIVVLKNCAFRIIVHRLFLSYMCSFKNVAKGKWGKWVMSAESARFRRASLSNFCSWAAWARLWSDAILSLARDVSKHVWPFNRLRLRSSEVWTFCHVYSFKSSCISFA